jgi:hypothetical protein
MADWDGKSRPSNAQYRSNYDDIFKKKQCPCGRSPTGKCIGWHGLTESDYQVKLQQWKEKHADQNDI